MTFSPLAKVARRPLNTLVYQKMACQESFYAKPIFSHGEPHSTRLRDWPYQAALGAIDGRSADIQSRSDDRVAHTPIRRQRDLGTLDIAWSINALTQASTGQALND